MSQPLATGGAIADGTYDLVRLVDHTKPTGPWSSNEAPAFRLAFRFTTQDRSPNHAEGSVVTAMDMPPAVGCESGRFATVDNELRGLRAHANEISSAPYSLTPDGWMILLPHATFVFRRRG